MDYGDLLYSGFSSALVFLVKFGICYWIYKYIRETSNKLAREGIGTIRIYLKVLWGCVIAAVVLAGIQFANDGSYCTSQDMYGCYKYEYDDEFTPMPFDEAVKLLFTYLFILFVIGYFAIKQGIRDAESNFEYIQDYNQTFKRYDLNE